MERRHFLQQAGTAAATATLVAAPALAASSATSSAKPSVRHLTAKDVMQWVRHKDGQMFLGGVLDHTNSDHISVGYGRYKKGESNDWVVTYDEVNIVTKGAFTFRTAAGDFTAKAGEILFITKGTKVTYAAPEDAEIIYVTYPHWMEAQTNSAHAGMLDDFQPVDKSQVID